MATSSVNVWLAIWAGIAPILTGAGSAWWSRRNQVNDRESAIGLEERRREAAQQELHEARIRNDLSQQLNWRRQTFIDFLSASYDFIYKGQGSQEADVRERHRERFAKCYSTLMLLDSPNIGEQANRLWNACVWVNIVQPTDPASDNAAQELMDARQEFMTKAHQLLADQISSVDIRTGLPATSPSS